MYVLLMIPGKAGEPSLLFVKRQLHSSVYIRINFRSIHTSMDVLGTFEVLKRNKEKRKVNLYFKNLATLFFRRLDDESPPRRRRVEEEVGDDSRVRGRGGSGSKGKVSMEERRIRRVSMADSDEDQVRSPPQFCSFY